MNKDPEFFFQMERWDLIQRSVVWGWIVFARKYNFIQLVGPVWVIYVRPNVFDSVITFSRESATDGKTDFHFCHFNMYEAI